MTDQFNTASSPPAGHFLSLPPTYFTNLTTSNPSLTSSHSALYPGGHAVNTATTASADFDVDVRTGFLPPDACVSELGGEWAVWEEALRAARGGGKVGGALRLGGGARESIWRVGIEEMPIIEIDGFRSSIPHIRRAHVVLTFLLHFFVHTHPIPSTPRTLPLPIPASISVPLLKICPLLGIPPILTYADTVLYNSHAENPAVLASMRSNPLVRSLETFTNTKDEEHFFLTSARCELAGVEALGLMRSSLQEAFMADQLGLSRLTYYLGELAKQIDVIGDIILDVRNGCDPGVFYHVIRPWFKGGDSDGPASAGWLFLGADDLEDLAGPSAAEHSVQVRGRRRSSASSNRSGSLQLMGNKARKFSGPSAGQSTLIHALDVFLTVDHVPKALLGEKGPSAEETFMTRMAEYMPHQHRSFLTHLAGAPHPIRKLVLEHREKRPALAAAYDEALSALKRLREKHMRIASLYIIQQARRRPTEELIALGAPRPEDSSEAEEEDRKLEATSLSEIIREQETQRDRERADDEVRGTGGTALIKFLKMCRDNTVATMVNGRV